VDDVTAIKTVRIVCDHLGPVDGCEANWVGQPDQTTFSVRTDLQRREGWRHRGGRDWCPEHAERRKT
jgi:hypothetical protein